MVYLHRHSAGDGNNFSTPTTIYQPDTNGPCRTLSGQAPFVILGMILVWRKLDVAPPSWRDDEADRPTMLAKLKRVDFLGAFLLSVTIISLLLVLDLGGEKVPWSSVTILFLGALGLKAAISFAVVETKWAKDPIFPLYLLRNYDVITSYSIISLQNASQTAVSDLLHCISPSN